MTARERPRLSDPAATIVVGLGFGDEGKGTVVDALARRSARPPVVVRFNGGCQAAHNVVTDDGRHHTFAQLGSASFVAGARTHLSRFMLVEPFALFREAEALEQKGVPDPLARLSIDPGALVITPFQQAANRLRESLRRRPHGSCGLGIGETMADSLAGHSLRVGDLRSPARALAQLADIQARKAAEFEDRRAQLEELTATVPERAEDHAMLFDPAAPGLFAEALCELAAELTIRAGPPERESGTPLLFEGAQGVLLDEWYGFHPHTTWSTTTTANAETLLAEWGIAGPVTRLGVLRTTHTRHGAGPLPGRDAGLEARCPEPHNGTGRWQGAFRVGHFDAVLARYALEVCPVDALALTHLDRLAESGPGWISGYRESGRPLTRLPIKAELEDLRFQERLTERLRDVAPILEAGVRPDAETVAARLGVPVSLTSRGPRSRDKRVTGPLVATLGGRGRSPVRAIARSSARRPAGARPPVPA